MIHYHRLAADQGNVRSLLRIGDAYYYGVGVGEADRNKSAAVYLRASAERSAQAMFNLGTYTSTGWGFTKDLHLAKRYYDMVLSADPKAWVPVQARAVEVASARVDRRELDGCHREPRGRTVGSTPQERRGAPGSRSRGCAGFCWPWWWRSGTGESVRRVRSVDSRARVTLG